MTAPPALWPHLSDQHPFGTANLPYGVFETQGQARVGVRLGDEVLDLARFARGTEVDPQVRDAWATDSLNAFLELGPEAWTIARGSLIDALHRSSPGNVRRCLTPLSEVQMRLPIVVADYVDFYASEHHATNVGRIFRPNTDPLPANWKHLPIGYHGRSGTVVVSGTPVTRPSGQVRPSPEGTQHFGPTGKLDIEAELGFVVGGSTRMGQPVGVDEARRHIFGAVLLNDWSARDIQAWEYVPLGPFLGKSFATSISPWVVPMEALRAARVDLRQANPTPLDYLRGASQPTTLDVHLRVRLNGSEISRPEYRSMYWSPEQMLAHMTVNGASLRSGDLYGSGTISGPERHQRGSLLELSWDGAEPIGLRDGGERTYLLDGDSVVIDAWAPGPRGGRIGFGEVAGMISPP